MDPKVAHLVGMNEMIEKLKSAESQLKDLQKTLEELGKIELSINWKDA